MTRVEMQDSYGATKLGYTIQTNDASRTFADTDLSNSIPENWQCYEVDVHQIRDDTDTPEVYAEARVGSSDADDDNLIKIIQDGFIIRAVNYLFHVVASCEFYLFVTFTSVPVGRRSPAFIDALQ